MNRFRPYFHFMYYAHRIFPKIKGVYLNGSYKIERERKLLIRVGWACIKEGLINVLSRGTYTADYAVDEAFRDVDKIEKEKNPPPHLKTLKSPNYNYFFNLKDGFFARWGKTEKDDPEYCPFGAEIMDIEISTKCSKGCKFCYKSNVKTGTYMDFETFKEMFGKFPKMLTQIAFGIGDIDSNPDLWKIMQYCRDNKVIPNITINGERMTPEYYDKLVELCGAVAVSHYSDEKCFNAIYELNKRGMKQVNIHKLLSEETKKSCLRLMKETKRDERLKGLNAIVFLWLKPKGNRNSLHQLKSLSQYKDIVDYAFDNNIRIGFDSCSASSFTKVIKDRPNFKELDQMVESCESTLFSYYINVDGIGFPCSFTEGENGWQGIDLKKIKDFKEVWYHPETLRFRLGLLGNKDCNNCRQCPVFNLKCGE